MRPPMPARAIAGLITVAVWCTLAQRAAGQADEDRAVQQAYDAYVRAWRMKDLTNLSKLISDDYLAVNFEGRVSDKANELATAREDLEWISMNVDEIHPRVFGTSAIASGIISAQGKRRDGTTLTARVRFLAALVKRDGRWQLVATQSSSTSPRTPK